jgi:hypothetical protein
VDQHYTGTPHSQSVQAQNTSSQPAADPPVLAQCTSSRPASTGRMYKQPTRQYWPNVQAADPPVLAECTSSRPASRGPMRKQLTCQYWPTCWCGGDHLAVPLQKHLICPPSLQGLKGVYEIYNPLLCTQSLHAFSTRSCSTGGMQNVATFSFIQYGTATLQQDRNDDRNHTP